MFLGGAVAMYGPPLLLAIGALLIHSSRASRKIVYLTVFIGLSILLTLLISVFGPNALGPWIFMIGPAIVITVVRLVMALVIDPRSRRSVGE